jgi:transcriptional regulator of aroF, aroG, tyrA and aromatic amino acid transport
VTINCGAIPENLVESELFGYVKGAFTGAMQKGKLGRFEIAIGGSVLLDEINCLSLHSQASLLRFLESGEIQKVGGLNNVKIDVRILATSNIDLHKLVQEGLFRPDLYYRLNIFRIHLPPLRKRKDDLPNFVHYFLRQIGGTMEPPCNFNIVDGAMAKIYSYNWPGNLRELEAALCRAVMLCEGGSIEEEHIHLGEKLVQVSTDFGNEVLEGAVEAKIRQLKWPAEERGRLKEFLLRHYYSPVSNRDYSAFFGVSAATARNRLKELVNCGLLNQEGTKKGSHYYLNTEKDENKVGKAD